MSRTTPVLSPLLRLPRELRDQIFSYLFKEGDEVFPAWPSHVKHNRTLYNALPSICRGSKQLFLKATPFFLNAATINSDDAETSKRLITFLEEFPEEAGFKAITDFNLYEWTEDAVTLQLSLISRFTELEAISLVFAMKGLSDGWSEEDHDYNLEQDLWYKNKIHYRPRDGRSVEEEKQKLAEDTQAFIDNYGFDRILALPKLRIVQFQFYDLESGKFYRHRLCNPLWRWAEGVMAEKLGTVEDLGHVSTDFSEDYDRIIES